MKVFRHPCSLILNMSISMGLVLIPVGLYKTTVDNDIHFNQLDKESKARIRYKKYCSHCNKEVGPDDIFQDEYQARLRDAIMKKIQGKEIITADTSESGK